MKTSPLYLPCPEGEVFGDCAFGTDSDDELNVETSEVAGKFVVEPTKENDSTDVETIVGSIHFSGPLEGDLFVEVLTTYYRSSA